MRSFPVCLRKILLLLILTMNVITSCSPLHNEHNAQALECQLTPIHGENLLRIMDEDGHALSPELTFKVQAQFQEDSGLRYELALSPKACVRLPQNEGRLLISLHANRKAVVYRHEKNQKGLERINLEPAPAFHTVLPCAKDGFFANQSLIHDWSFESTANLHSLKFVVRAMSERDHTSHSLFTKDFGGADLKLLESLDTSALQEGVYRLEAEAYDLLDNFGQTARPLLKNDNCLLTILRRPPLVGGIEDRGMLPVFEPGTALPWRVDGPGTQLYACLEERTGPGIPTLVAPASCAAQSRCTQPDSFQAVNVVTSDKAGLFDIYAFAKDRAGNASAMRCQTVAFSTRPPDLSLRWNEEAWNQDGAFMRELDVFIKAKVSIGSHDVLAVETLKQTLECKVEFVLQAKDILSGKDVICTKGRCRGRSLSQYVPCDPDIEFTLQDAWQQTAIQQSLMRLLVRAQDGAGHVREVSRSVWIHDRSWNMQRLEYKSEGKTVNVNQLIQDPSGHFLASFHNGTVQKWNGTDWENTTPALPGTHQFIELFLTPEQQLYASFIRTMPEDKSVSALARWDGKTWIFIAAPDPTASSPFFERCFAMNIAKKGFYCRSADNLRYFDGTSWGDPIPLPNVQFSTGQCGVPLQFITVDAQNRIWLACDRDLFVLGAGSRWQKAFDFLQNGNLSISSIFSDGVGRIWVRAQNQEVRKIGYFSDVDTYHSIPLPPAQGSRFNPCTPGLAHDNRLTCERYFWNPDTKDWTLLPEFADLGYKKFAILNRDYGGTEVFAPVRSPGSPIRAWAAPADGLYITSGSRLVHWPSALTQAYLYAESAVYQEKDGTLWFNASYGRSGTRVVHRIQPQRLVAFDQKILGLSHGLIGRPWEGADGHLKVFFSEHGIYEFKDGLWQAERSNLPTEVEHHPNFEASDGTLYYAASNNVWIRPDKEASFTLLNHQALGGAPWGFDETEDGTVWFFTWGTRQIHRVIHGKLLSDELPDDSTDMTLGTLVYKGNLVVMTGSAFYKAETTTDSRLAFKRIDHESLGFTSLPTGMSRSIQRLALHRYAFNITLEDGRTVHFIGNTLDGIWETFTPTAQLLALTANEAGVMFAMIPEGIMKKMPGGEWVMVLTFAQFKESISQDAFMSDIFVDKHGRLWILSGGPWLLSRLD